MRAIIFKEFRELRRDRRTMAMLVVMPLVMLIVFGYSANFSPNGVRTEVLGPGAAQLAASLPYPLFHIQRVDPMPGPAAAARIARDDLRTAAFVVAVVTSADVTTNVAADAAVAPGSGPRVSEPTTPGAPGGLAPVTAYIDGVDLLAAQRVVAVFKQSGGRVRTVVLFNPGLKTTWVMVPGLIGLILTFIAMIITSIGLVREREAGTLDQLAVMPLHPSAIILGKIVPYFLLAALNIAVVTTAGVAIFRVPFTGSPLVFGLAAAVFLFAVLGLGVLISTVSRRTGQAIQLALMLLLPQALLCGLIFPVQSMGPAVRWIGYLLPLTYFIQASKGVMLRGAGFADLWLQFGCLATMAIVVFSAAVARFRRDLAPRHRHRHREGEDLAAPETAAGGAG